MALLPKTSAKSIHVYAPTVDVGRFYAAADVYVCSSRLESYPRTILEALAVGLPIVSTRVGGVPEALGDDATYYRPGDVAGLAAMLERMIEDPALRLRMRQSSKARWQEISQGPDMVRRYRFEIEEVVRSAVRGVRCAE